MLVIWHAILSVAWHLFVLQVVLCQHDNEISKRLMRILKELRARDPSSYQSCRLVRQGEQPRELSLFLTNLVEDQTAGSSGYVDWILQVFRQSQGSWRWYNDSNRPFFSLPCWPQHHPIHVCRCRAHWVLKHFSVICECISNLESRQLKIESDSV